MFRKIGLPAYIDLHCDTVLLCDTVFANKYGFSPFGLRSNSLQIDVQKLKAANCLAQFFAIFCDISIARENNGSLMDEFERLHKVITQQISDNHEHIALALNLSGIHANVAQGKVSAILAIEDGGVIDSPEKIRYFFDKGIRYITLVWNYANSLGHPAETDDTSLADKGLTELGREVVAVMQETGIMVDVSHANVKTASEVLDIARKPVIASHSCSAALYNHPRNMNDQLIRRVAAGGGVIGVSYFQEFLQQDNQAPAVFATIKNHIDHIINVGGEDCAALGSDFDGYPVVAGSDIETSVDVPRFGEYLLANGYSYSRLEKLFSDNALRVIRETIG